MISVGWLVHLDVKKIDEDRSLGRLDALTREHDLGGHVDIVADQGAASRSQNIRLVDLAGGRGGGVRD